MRNPLYLLPVVLACGCSTLSNTEKGVGLGGALGAGTGALVGAAVKHPGIGAAVGAGVGALAGGLTGHAIDESEKKQEAQLAAATAVPVRGPLTIDDVVQMAQAHVSDNLIIAQIRSTGPVFRLTANDTIWLKQQGVSDAVIQEMMATPNRYGQRVYSATPVYVPPPPPPSTVVIYERPPPPAYVGFGFGYHARGCRRW